MISIKEGCLLQFRSATMMLSNCHRTSPESHGKPRATGFYTRHLIPEVGTKVTFPEERDVGISYCRLLLHDTLLRDDAHRTGISHTTVCECGVERQTADHFLLHCNRHQDARNKLKNVVENIIDLSACRSRTHLSKSLLLATRCNDVTRK